MYSFSHQFSQLPNFFVNTKCDENRNWKIVFKELVFVKNFLVGIMVPNFLRWKIKRKAGIKGQVLGWKTGVKNFSTIFQFENRF